MTKQQTALNSLWRKLYSGTPYSSSQVPPSTMLALFREAVLRNESGPAIHYLDATISYAELDRLSDAFACILARDGFAAGDRIALFMQNIPQFLVACIAAWKCGGIVVPLSPLHRSHELGHILPDCRPTSLVVQDDLATHVHAAIAGISDYAPRVYTTSPLRMQSRDDPRVLAGLVTGEGPDLLDLIEEARAAGSVPPLPSLDPQSPALIVYTSGTTGEPKGAIITHDNGWWNAGTAAQWFGLAPGDGPVFGMAPLFHITGLIGGIGMAWHLAEALVIMYRFHPEVALEAMMERRPAFAVGAITAYMAMMNCPASSRDHFASFKAMITGGAPTAPAVLEAFREHSGKYLHNGYGLTETTAGLTTVPMGREAPTDPASGTLSVGIPVFDAGAWIADDDGNRLGASEVGEIILTGRSVSPGYWNRLDATAESMRADGFRTGDVGFIDEAGWVYVVDRKKDMINASGFKVWPREVEDVLYTHPEIREAAVVGVADAYRGETVRAVVSLKQGATLDSAALIDWCRERMAVYKVPKQVLVMDELPKNPAGKILRRELRD